MNNSNIGQHVSPFAGGGTEERQEGSERGASLHTVSVPDTQGGRLIDWNDVCDGSLQYKC